MDMHVIDSMSSTDWNVNYTGKATARDLYLVDLEGSLLKDGQRR